MSPLTSVILLCLFKMREPARGSKKDVSEIFPALRIFVEEHCEKWLVLYNIMILSRVMDGKIIAKIITILIIRHIISR